MIGTRDLALYAAIVGTLNGLWTLYGGIVRDRARIRLAVYASEVHTFDGQDPLPGISFAISNRGRRAARISHIARVAGARTGMRATLMELSARLPLRLGEAEGETINLGGDGIYVPGSIPFTRWFVVDGADRVYPLHERYRHRLEAIVFWRQRRRTGNAPADDA